MRTALVTGGAGFIGSHLVDRLLSMDYQVIILDKMTYAAHVDNLPHQNEGCVFVKDDIAHREAVRELLARYTPDVCFHLAAESHVSRSIETAEDFIHTNVLGTFVLLDEWVIYNRGAKPEKQARFIYCSTDEVYGSIAFPGQWSEQSPLEPNNPYSASKAAGDLLVRSWANTHGVQANIVHGANNYGPRQHQEKLIPKVITSILDGKQIQIHGDGRHVRDWLHVDEMTRALQWVYEQGHVGRIYDVPGNCEMSTWDVVMLILSKMKEKAELAFVPDRPGNDRRYNMVGNIPKWNPGPRLDQRIDEVIQWYRVNNRREYPHG